MNAQNDAIIPISLLFYDDAGPHIVSAGRRDPVRPAGTFTPARGQDLHDLLNASIAQLGGVSGDTKRKTPPRPTPVDIQTLLYSGRGALERAFEIRNAVRSSGIAASPETVDELLDLIGLAITEQQ